MQRRGIKDKLEDELKDELEDELEEAETEESDADRIQALLAISKNRLKLICLLHWDHFGPNLIVLD